MIFKETRWDGAVERVCRSWEGTPYRLNRGRKGLGADCLHFAASVLDELYGSEHSKDLNSLPPDACIHNKQGVMAAARALFVKYPAFSRVTDSTVEAGDLMCFGRSGEVNSTQHLMVAAEAGKLWHASPPCVHYTSLMSLKSLKLVCSYRASDKEKWQC